MWIDIDREALVSVLQPVLCNASSYPREVQPRILGRDMGPLLASVISALSDTYAGDDLRVVIERLEKLAEDRGYSRGFNVGWDAAAACAGGGGVTVTAEQVRTAAFALAESQACGSCASEQPCGQCTADTLAVLTGLGIEVQR